MNTETIYVGSKVRTWTEKGGWDDEPVKVMETSVGIVFERSRHHESFGLLVLNPDGTASHFQWWYDAAELRVIDNQLAANQDFVHANLDMLDSDEEPLDELDEEEDEDDLELPNENAPDSDEDDSTYL